MKRMKCLKIKPKWRVRRQWRVLVEWAENFSLGRWKSSGNSTDGCTTLWMCLMSLGSHKMMKWYILLYVYLTSIYKNKWRNRLKSKRGKVKNIIDSQKAPEKDKKKNKKISKHNSRKSS